MFMGPRNWYQGMNSASLCSLAGRYENPIPPQCLAPIVFLKIPALYTRVQCGGGYGVLGLRQINTFRKVPIQVNFFRLRHFALPSMSLIFLRTSCVILGRQQTCEFSRLSESVFESIQLSANQLWFFFNLYKKWKYRRYIFDHEKTREITQFFAKFE